MNLSKVFPKNSKASDVKKECDKRNIRITSDKRGGVTLSKQIEDLEHGSSTLSAEQRNRIKSGYGVGS